MAIVATPTRGAPSLLVPAVSAHPAGFSRVQRARFRNMPLLYAAAAFAAGIVCAQWWRPASTLVVASVLLIGVGFVASFAAPRVALACVLLAWLALGWTCAELRPRPVPSRALLPYENGLSRDVVGTVTLVQRLQAASPAHTQALDPLRRDETADDELPGQTGEEVYSLDVALSGIEEVTPDVSRIVPASGGVRITAYAVPGHMPPLACGMTVRLTSRLHAPQQFRDPGVWQREQYLAENGIVAVGSTQAAGIHVLAAGSPPLACRLVALRGWAAQRMLKTAALQRAVRLPRLLRLSVLDAGVLNAMLLGDRSALTQPLRVRFERTGTFHLFVVAGMHVTLIAAAAYWLLAKLRLRNGIVTVGALFCTAFYAVLTGFGEPVQRALLMTAAYLFARLLFRERSVLNAIGAAALTMLVLRPQACFDVGFQMTVLIALAIGGIASPLLERTLSPYARACKHIDSLRMDQQAPPHIAQFRLVLRTLGQLLATAFWKRLLHVPTFLARACILVAELAMLALTTEIVMALPMAVYFHRVTPLALPVNLLVLPLLPVVMIAAALTFLSGLLAPWAALLPATIVAAALHVTSFLIDVASGLRTADWRLPAPPVAVELALVLLLLLAGCLLRSRYRSRAWCGVGLLPLVLLLIVVPYPARLHRGTLEVTAIDVGQGDSILMVSPQGRTMLIDAGGQVGSEASARRSTFDIGEEVVSPYLWSRGIRRLDVLALTHAHLDHIGGMDAVLRNFKPRELWLSVEPQSELLQQLLQDTRQQGTVIRHLHRGDATTWGGMDLHVLSPGPDYVPQKTATNDDSLVLRADFGRASALLEGDAERPSEDGMLTHGEISPVTLLKTGHHGSNTSTTESLLLTAHPKAAVISCGRGNRFGHPRMQVLQRLQSAGVATSRTDTMGATQYLLGSDGSLQTHVLASNGP